MLSVSPAFIVLAWGLLLSSGAGAAEPEASGPMAGVRRIELRADPVSPLPEVRIGPGLSTTVFFDSRIRPEQVELEGRERFQRLGIAEDHLALVPSATFRHGERLRLEVRFHDGAAPERAAVMLVVDAGQVERQVEVYRHPRTAESYRQEVEDLKTGMVRLQREMERLRVTRAPAGCIEALVASLKGADDFRTRKPSYERVSGPFRLSVDVIRVAILGKTWAGLHLVLKMEEQGADWTAVGASLVDAEGRTVKVLPPWQQGPLRFGQLQTVVVSLETTKTPLHGRYTLELRDEAGGRTVTIEGLEVP